MGKDNFEIELQEARAYFSIETTPKFKEYLNLLAREQGYASAEELFKALMANYLGIKEPI